MSKAKTSVTAKKVESDWQIKAVPQYRDALRQAGCRWDDKKICWIYTGEKLPDVVQQIIDGTYGTEGLLGTSESPNNPRSTPQVSMPPSIVIIDMEKAEGDKETLRKQADTLASELGYSFVASISMDDPNLSQKLAEVISVAMGKKPASIHAEPDGTCPYMVENQRSLKPCQDWLGWMTCCECGVFLDLESNRKAGSKPLMGLPYGKVICRNCHAAKHNLPDIQLDAPKAKLPTKTDVEFKPGQFVEVMTNKVMGVVYNLSDQSDTVFIAVPDNSKKGGGYCGMGYSASVLKLSDYTLPERQVEFLQALAKGEAVAKNGATRKSLRNWGLISDDADWNQIILTRIGKAWLELNGMMPNSGLVLGDGTPLSEATTREMSYAATTPANPTCPRCNSKTHLNSIADIHQSGLVVGTNREYICSSCKHTFEQRQIFEKPKTNPKPAFAPKSHVTPLRQQYLDLKAQYPDHILFYRLGDFYETFDEDAETAAHELDLVLTGRPISRDERVPMAGVPHHAVDQYINRLVEKGYKVAVAEQMSEPNGRGIVERKVTRTLEPNLPEKGEVSECEPQVDETWIWHHVSDSGWGIDEKIRVRIVQIKKRIQVEVPTKKGEPVLRWVERKSLIERVEPKPEKPTPAEMWWIDESDNILRDDNPVFDHFAVLRGPFDSREEAEAVLKTGKLPATEPEEREITIKTTTGERTVTATIFGQLGVHRALFDADFSRTYWSITHLKSGMKIDIEHKDKAEFFNLAQRLSELDFDKWFDDRQAGKMRTDFADSVRSIITDWRNALTQQETAMEVLGD